MANWDEIYRTTQLEDLHWYPGEPDQILKDAVEKGWLAGRTVLDIGSGQGTDAIYLARHGYDVTSLDLSTVAREIALRLATQQGVTLTYHVGSALDMAFPAESFDIIVERGCFHHIANADRATYASEVARVLRPGGTYLYRSFCWKSQFQANPADALTEEAVRSVFEPHFTFQAFSEYEGMGQNGRSRAEMHWGLLTRIA
jgi:cyclopropane fatty-acyl-phospholipid synthase-like methyltransferase